MDTSSQNQFRIIIFMLVSSIVLGILFDYFFVGKALGFGYSLYAALVLLGLIFVSNYSKKPIPKDVIWLGLGFLFFSSMVFIRASDLLTILNIIGGTLLLLLIVERLTGKKLQEYSINDYLKIPFLLFKFLPSSSETISELSKFHKEGHKRRISQIVRGIAITLPILVIFLILFSSADLVFRKYLLDFINIDWESFKIWRLLLVLAVSFTALGFYSYSVRKIHELTQKEEKPLKRVGHIEVSILLVSINLLFIIFLILQFTYLFGGENNLIKEGITYAEYARRGFFELIAVAVISLLLLWNTDKRVEKNEGKHTFIFKILSSALVLQVIFIMVSAFKRLNLYEEAFGFTTLRLYSHVFIIFLAIVFLLFLYKTFIDKREKMFAFRVFLLICLFLFGINMLNPDAFIARKNIERYELSGKLDVKYLDELSSDAIPTSIKLLETNQTVRNEYAYRLYWKLNYYNTSPRFLNWQSLNFSLIQARKILTMQLPLLEENKYYRVSDAKN